MDFISRYKKVLLVMSLIGLLNIVFVRVLHTNYNFTIFIILYFLYSMQCHKKIATLFGRRETITAFLLGLGCTIVYLFLIDMLKVYPAMDFFYDADQSRVFKDFTLVNDPAEHYRIKVHPFYVIIWQTIYHLLFPFAEPTLDYMRIYEAVASGFCIFLFSLLVTRISDSGKLNIILPLIMAFTFPQILQSGMIIESFTFTQLSIILCFLYFSFAIPDKKYNLFCLIPLALLMCGNLITNIAVFGIFYLILIFEINEKKLKKIAVFSVIYTVVFSILLLIQYYAYETNVPDIITMIKLTFMEDTQYVYTSYTGSDLINYLHSILNIFFATLPVDSHLPLYCSLVFPIIAIILHFNKSIKDKKFFLAIVCTLLFFVGLHFFYGRMSIVLYAQMFTTTILTIMAFARKSIIYSATLTFLLLFMIGYNLTVAFGVKTVSNYIFSDVYTYALKKELYEEYGAGKIDLLLKNSDQKLYMGMGKRNKYVFEGGILKKLSTGEVIYDAGDAEYYLIEPAKSRVYIIRDNKTEMIYEDGNIITTGADTIETSEIIFKTVSDKALLSTLYHEILFSIADGRLSRLTPEGKFEEIKKYNDIAIVTSLLHYLQSTDELHNHLSSLKDLYDNPEEKDYRNLGQLLFFQSMIKDRDSNLIDKVLKESAMLRDKDGCIAGDTRATAWLGVGLKSLGMDEKFYEYAGCDKYVNARPWQGKRDVLSAAKILDQVEIFYGISEKNECDDTDIPCIKKTYPVSADKSYEIDPVRAATLFLYLQGLI